MERLETNRLMLRHFTMEDRPAVHRVIFSDPEVCHFYCGTTKSLQQTKRWLRFRTQQYDYGVFGLLAVILKANDALIGLCGLQSYLASEMALAGDPEQPYSSLEVELTYAFGREYWGNGYATEACRAVTHYAFCELRLRRLVTHCDIENTRAERLQERLGMRRMRNLRADWPDPAGILDNNLI